jgi:SPP1 gp7 family putative phage head morphogenesis protein
MTSGNIDGNVKGFVDPVISLLEEHDIFEQDSKKVLTGVLWTDMRHISKIKNGEIAAILARDELPVNFMLGYLKENKLYNPSAAQRYVEKRALSLVKDLTRTDIVRIRSYLLSHWPVNKYEFRTFCRDQAYVFSEARADLIHRTEMHTAAEAGHLQVAKDVGLRWKIWHAIMDNRTRPRHAQLNNERTTINATFSNGLEYPQEPRCRCWCTYD